MVLYSVDKKLFLSFIVILFFSICKAETDVKQTQIVLRSIGHAFLLQLDDSTSRVLAIKNINNRYAVEFERTLSFEPDVLSSTVLKVMQENKISDRYIVEVEQCASNEVIYSFEASLSKKDNLIACKQRQLPVDCYVFYFTVISPTIKAAKSTSPSNKQYKFLFLLIFLLLGGVIFYVVRRKRKTKLNTDLIAIGKFQYDKKSMTLNLKAQSIELSTKESDLLFLLFSNENQTLERAFILNHIWGDEGDYVGRTLDVFISKLRKKLEADPSLKIINVRGIGYRFVVNQTN